MNSQPLKFLLKNGLQNYYDRKWLSLLNGEELSAIPPNLKNTLPKNSGNDSAF